MSKLKFNWLDADTNTLVDAGSGAIGVLLEASEGLTSTASGIKIEALKVTNSMLAGSIASTKLTDNDDIAKLSEDEAVTGIWTFNTALPTTSLDPSADNQFVSKGYVDAVAEGLKVKEPAVVATTAAIPAVTYANGTAGVGATLTADAVGVLTIDGRSTLLGDILLIKDQVAGLQNGNYLVTTAGEAAVAFILTRTEDYDEASQIPGASVFVHEGTVNADTTWVNVTNPPITMGTTSLNILQLSGAGLPTASNGVKKVINDLQADLNTLTGAIVDVATDSIAIVDANDSNLTRKESISDLMGIVAGTVTATALSAASGVLKVDVPSLTVDNTPVGADLILTSVGGAPRSSTITGLGALLQGTTATSAITATAGVLAVTIPGVTNKATLVGADSFLISDSADTAANKEISGTIIGTMLAGVGTTSGLKSTTGVLEVDILGLTGKATVVGADSFMISDSAAAGANKDITGTIIGTMLAAGTNSGIASATGNLSIDINDLAINATFDPAADYLPFEDVTDSGSDKALWSVIATAIAGTGLTATNGVLSADTGGATNLMHLVTAGEVSAGFLTLSVATTTASSVTVTPSGGIEQVNKQNVGSTGATADFDIISLNELHINNTGAATGLSGDILAGDILIVQYESAQA